MEGALRRALCRFGSLPVPYVFVRSGLTLRQRFSEFAFMMPGTGIADVARIAERIRLRFSEAARSVGGEAVASTVSVGVATTSAPAAQLADLMAAADRALYRAKAEGRDRVTTIDCDAKIEPAEAAPSIVPRAQVFSLSLPSRSAA